MAEFPARLPKSWLEKQRSREPSQPALSYEHIEKARSRKPGQPGQPGSYEEALTLWLLAFVVKQPPQSAYRVKWLFQFIQICKN